jgi:hypothetical protein
MAEEAAGSYIRFSRDREEFNPVAAKKRLLMYHD